MSKYDPLQHHLAKKGMDHVPMSFEEIEALIGGALPPSARKHRAWWSNNPSNSVITHAWLSAGYKSSDVDLARESLVFRKDAEAAPAPAPAEPSSGQPAFGAMKGSIVVRADIDLTQPADPAWSAVYE